MKLHFKEEAMRIVSLFIMLMVVGVFAQNRARTDRVTKIEIVDVTTTNDSIILEENRAIMADSGGIVIVEILAENRSWGGKDTAVFGIG